MGALLREGCMHAVPVGTSLALGTFPSCFITFSKSDKQKAPLWSQFFCFVFKQDTTRKGREAPGCRTAWSLASDAGPRVCSRPQGSLSDPEEKTAGQLAGGSPSLLFLFLVQTQKNLKKLISALKKGGKINVGSTHRW